MAETKSEEKDLEVKVEKSGLVHYGKDLSFIQRIAYIQKNLKAPKTQVNSFGGFNYRSCEDIVEALKPMLDEMILTINDEIVMVGDRYYVKSTVSIESEKSGKISAVAYAREAESKTKMDDAQVTGSSSSYARKYALNALLAIDDSKDPDFFDNSKKVIKVSNQPPTPPLSGDEVLSGKDRDPEWIRGQSVSKEVKSGECPECHAIGKFHRKGCSYGVQEGQ